MKESEQFLSYGELAKYLHEYRYESSYYQKPTKGFFDLGDIAALAEPDLALWEVTDCPEVDWDLAYKFKKQKVPYSDVMISTGIERSIYCTIN